MRETKVGGGENKKGQKHLRNVRHGLCHIFFSAGNVSQNALVPESNFEHTERQREIVHAERKLFS